MIDSRTSRLQCAGLAGALAAGLLASACTQRPRAERDEILEVAFQTSQVLEVETHNGAIELVRTQASDETPMVRIEAHLIAEGDTQEEADRRVAESSVRCDFTQGRMRVWADFPGDPADWSDGASFVIHTPNVPALELKTHNGSVSADGFEADAKVTSHNGSLELRGTLGSVEATTHNGPVTVDGARGQVRVRTHNGGVELRQDATASGGFDLETHNGGVTVWSREGIGGSLLLSTHNGDRSVDPGGAEIREDHSSGDDRKIRFSKEGPASRVLTHNGSITVHLR